jgi:hypothetical protein
MTRLTRNQARKIAKTAREGATVAGRINELTLGSLIEHQLAEACINFSAVDFASFDATELRSNERLADRILRTVSAHS